MSPRTAVRGLLVASLCAACACATVASRDEYRAYRAVRLAQDDTSQLTAMNAYLDSHPSGEWNTELRAQRSAMEPAYFDRAKSTADGLRSYLANFPDGQFVQQAQARLAALDTVAQNRATDAEANRDVTRAQREETLARRRRWASSAVAFWSRILLRVENWGAPIREVAAGNEDFDDAFAANPRPRCTADECIKFYRLDYAIVIPGQTQMEQHIELLLRLRFTEGQRLQRAELLMPNRGFSRWFELENQAFVIDQDPEARQAAIEWALQRIVPLVREIAPTAVGIDVVPEPIDPPRILAPNQPDPGASGVLGEAGDDTPGVAPEQGAPDVELAEAVDPESLVLPLAIAGLQVDDKRIVVFAAADDDEGPAYDGLFIELLPADADAEQAP